MGSTARRGTAGVSPMEGAGRRGSSSRAPDHGWCDPGGVGGPASRLWHSDSRAPSRSSAYAPGQGCLPGGRICRTSTGLGQRTGTTWSRGPWIRGRRRSAGSCPVGGGPCTEGRTQTVLQAGLGPGDAEAPGPATTGRPAPTADFSWSSAPTSPERSFPRAEPGPWGGLLGVLG